MKLELDDLPPGISRLVNHLAKPFPGDLQATNTNLTAKISADDNSFDRCHHKISFDDAESEQGAGFILDWQRLYDENPEINERSTDRLFKEWTDAALSYFTRFGEGDLAYD